MFPVLYKNQSPLIKFPDRIKIKYPYTRNYRPTVQYCKSVRQGGMVLSYVETDPRFRACDLKKNGQY